MKMCSRRHQAFKVMRYTSNPFFRQKELKKRTDLEGLNPKKQEKEINTQSQHAAIEKLSQKNIPASNKIKNHLYTHPG